MKIAGVNLGNWLVLEKWMNPAMFAGTDAEDEYYLPEKLSPEVYAERIRMHRLEYIAERDFATIHSWGMNTIRIPVPYFIFGDRAPFIGCIEELDKAFNWAEKYDLQILIDLHTAPMGQNGFDNGGISGICCFSKHPEEVEFVLTVLERLAERYGNRKALWGIEILNEPLTEEMWDVMNVQARYIPVNEEWGRESAGIPMSFLRQFYCDAYDRMRVYLPEEKYVVFHDGFQMKAWKDFMREEKYKNVVLDTHLYLMSTDKVGKENSMEEYADYIQKTYAADVAEMEQYFPVVVGEWCLFNFRAEFLGDSWDPEIQAEKDAIYRRVAEEQLKAWENCSGYFYWSYKLLSDTVNEDHGEGRKPWDLGRCVANGWFPVPVEQ